MNKLVVTMVLAAFLGCVASENDKGNPAGAGGAADWRESEAIRTGTPGAVMYASGEASPRERMQADVQRVLDRAVAEGRQGAVQFCVYIDGECVVDAWAGTYATNDTRKIDGDSLFPIFSTEKQLLVTAAHRAHDQGLLDYDKPVKAYWPEFAGSPEKEALTVRQLLGHRAGLPTHAPSSFSVEQQTNWAYMVAWAAKQPATNPGTVSRYLSQSYGWYLGHTLENAFGRPIKELLDEQVLMPAGVERDFFFASGPSEDARMVTMYNSSEPWSVEWMNETAYRRAINPASLAVASARGIAKFYNRLCGFDGKPPLVRPETLREALKANRWSGEPVTPEINEKWIMVWGMGYGLWGDDKNLARVFGQGGLGGSEGMCDREKRICVGYTCNISSNYDGFNRITPELFRIVGLKTRYVHEHRPRPNAAKPKAQAAGKTVTIDVKDGGALKAAVGEICKIRKADKDVPIDVVFGTGDYDVSEAVALREGKDGFRSSESAAVTFRAADGAQPRLCGGRQVTGWTRTPFNGRDDVWAADVSVLRLDGRVSLFYYDGASMQLCRWPNADPNRPYSGGWAYVDGTPVHMYTEVPGERADEVHVKKADIRPWAAPDEGAILIFPRYNWWNDICPIAAFDSSNGVLRLARKIQKNIAPRPQDRYCLIGLREELDAPGEWYHDLKAGKVYFIPPNGEDPNQKRTAVVPQAKPLFLFENVTNVVVKGLEMCEAGKCVGGVAVDRCAVVGCRLHDVGSFDEAAVALSGTRNVVRGCDIWNAASYGIVVSGMPRVRPTPELRDGNVAENNYIHHCGKVNRHGFGVLVKGQGSRVANNLIHDLPRGGIYYEGRFLEIVRNRVRHVNLEMEDTAAIYGGGYIRNVGTKINGNWVSDSVGFNHDKNGVYAFFKTAAWGIYLDDCSGGAEVAGNLVEHCNYGGMHLHCARFNVVSNNVFVSSGGASGRPAQHSVSGWKAADKNPQIEYLRTRAKAQYDELIAASPAWTNYPPLAHSPAAPDAPDGFIMQGNRFVNNVWYYPDEPDSCVYSARNYNPRKDLFDNNVVWSGSTNVQVRLDNRVVPFASWQALGQDGRTRLADPLFVDPQGGDWSFRPGSPATALGIVPVHPERTGLYVDEIRRALPHEAEGVREHPEWLTVEEKGEGER